MKLARAFYEALADGLPVDGAVWEARKAVSLAVTNTVEWGTPVLYMRTPDGILFDLVTASPAVKPPAALRDTPAASKTLASPAPARTRRQHRLLSRARLST